VQINESASRNVSYFSFQSNTNLYLTFVINDPQVKPFGVTLFAAVSGAPACRIRPNSYVRFISRPSQTSWQPWMLQI